MNRTNILTLLAVAGFVLGAVPPCLAEEGVTANTVVIGHSAPFSGALAALGTDYRNGANLYFDYVNAQGGVAGRKIKLISLDDGYVVDKTVANTRKLIGEEHVFALFNMVGTPNILAILPLVTEAKVPFFSMLTGADVLRHPPNRYLFHTRAGYAEETAKLVDQAAQFGTKTFAVAYQDNDFGKAALRGAEQAIQMHGLRLVAAVPVDVKGNNVAAAVEQLSKVSPEAVMVLTAGKSGIDFMAAYRRKDAVAWLYALSVVSSQELVKALGEQSRGIVVSQVMPYPWSAKTPVVKEYQDLMKAGGKDKTSYSYASLEGFISAKLFSEALRRAGHDLTREKFIATLEGMRQADAGGFKVAFSPDSHIGSSFVDTTIIGPNGKFLR